MDAEEALTIGRRLRQIRKSRGKSLRVLARLSGIDRTTLSRIETGERALDKRSEVNALANTLQITPSELTTLPMLAPANGHADAATGEVRRALQAMIVGAPNGQVQTVEQLSARVHMMGNLRQRCAWGEMGTALPGLIADLHTSIATGRNDARLRHLAVLLHVLGPRRICTSCVHRMISDWSRHRWPMVLRNIWTIGWPWA